MPRCAVCKHPKRSELEEAAKAAGSSLDEVVGVCERFGVTRQGLERHLAKCGVVKTRARRKGSAPVEPEPASERRQVAPPRELGGFGEELRLLARRLVSRLDDPELSPQAAGSLSLRLTQTLKAIEQHQAGRPIHEHPEFDGLVDDLAGAVRALLEERLADVVSALGPKAPAGLAQRISGGLEERIAERLEELQAERASGGERQAERAA